MIKIPNFHDISKGFLSIPVANLLKYGRFRNKSNRGNLSFFLNDFTIDILIHDESHSVFHAQAPSPEYSLQTSNNSPIVSIIPETKEIINKNFQHRTGKAFIRILDSVQRTSNRTERRMQVKGHDHS